MRPSQIALLAAIGIVVAILLATAAWIALSATLAGELPAALGREQRTRTVALGAFTGVEIRGVWDVTIERGDAWAVELSYPAAFETRTSAQVENGQLVVGVFTTGFWTHFDDGRGGPRLTARVTMPTLEALRVSGAARIRFFGFEGTKLAVNASGATDLRGQSSRYSDVEVALSGAGSVDLRDVIATNASVALSGVGSIRVHLDGGTLSGNASGTGSIEYSGTVSEERIAKSGFVGIRRVN